MGRIELWRIMRSFECAHTITLPTQRRATGRMVTPAPTITSVGNMSIGSPGWKIWRLRRMLGKKEDKLTQLTSGFQSGSNTDMVDYFSLKIHELKEALKESSPTSSFFTIILGLYDLITILISPNTVSRVSTESSSSSKVIGRRRHWHLKGRNWTDVVSKVMWFKYAPEVEVDGTNLCLESNVQWLGGVFWRIFHLEIGESLFWDWRQKTGGFVN